MDLGEKLAILARLRKENASAEPAPEIPADIAAEPLVRETFLDEIEGGRETGPLVRSPAAFWEKFCRLVTPAAHPPDAPERYLFFDAETTGLGGAGSYAFLVGTLSRENDRFIVRQFFLPHPALEPVFLATLAEHFARATAVVSYNGRTFDAPLLAMRATLARRPDFLPALHLDLLHPARALWRGAAADCRLQTLEKSVCGYDRPPGDIDGAEIPDLYLAWLRDGDRARLDPVFTHNRADLVALLFLVADLVHASEGTVPVTDRGRIWLAGRADLCGDHARARDTLRAIAFDNDPVDAAAREKAAFRLARLLRQDGNPAAAANMLTDYIARGHDSDACTLALAWLFERHLADRPAALALVRQRLVACPDGAPATGHDRIRLERRLRRLERVSSTRS